MYTDQKSSTISCQQPKKEPEFRQISSELEIESARYYNLIGELYRKVDSISLFRENGEQPEANEKDPLDFVSRTFYEIRNLRKQNNRLEYILAHLNSIV